MKLSFKLLGVVVLGAVVGTAAVSTLTYRSTKSALQRAIGQNQLDLAERTMEQIDFLLHERHINIQANAGELCFIDILRGREVMPEDIARIKDLTVVTGPWDKLFLVNGSGKILLSSDETMIGRPIAGEPHRNAAFKEAVQGRTYHSDLFRLEDTKRFVVFYAAPVRDKKDPKQPVIGAVMGGFSWHAVEEILEDVPTMALLLNREGTVIADNEGEEGGGNVFLKSLKDKSFATGVLSEKESTLGVPTLASYAPQRGRLSYASDGWSLLLQTPLDVALAPAAKTALKLIAFLIPMIGIVVAVIVLLISKLVLRPVSLLTNAALAIEAGDLTRRVPVVSRDEIGRLANAFNAMTVRLREAYEGLEKKVEERTRELSHAQNELLQAQKMESIGRLTGGVAHDFNNLLGIITGYCELSMRQTPEGTLRQNLQEIKEAGERATALTRQLLAFSRKQVLQPKVMNLNEVLERSERMLRRLIGEDVRLLGFPAPDLGSIKADPTQMEQVIVNLVLNARDAMPHGGRITLETRNAELDGSYADKHPQAAPGPYVMLAVSDTGVGMDEETKRRVFEPFFTTKERGKGTGLGLSMVYGIVKQSGGDILVYSEPGRGTTFKVYFPRVEAKAASLSPESPAVSTRGTETILLVEDEPRLLTLFSKILGDQGYQVLPASSGQDALTAGQVHEGPIALLITDVIMPGMSGRETANRLASQRPDIKVLFLSGYTDNAIVHHGVLDEGTHFLQKPFTPEALAQKVRIVLDGR